MNIRLRQLAIVVCALFGASLNVCSPQSNQFEITDPRCSAIFTYHATQKEIPTTVALVGDFNGWSPDGWELEPDQEVGDFIRAFTLDSGQYLYRLRVDGSEILDPSNPLSLYGADGREHSLLIQKDCERPSLNVLSVTVEGGKTATIEIRYIPGADGNAIDADSLALRLDGQTLGKGVTITDDLLVVTLDAAIGKHHIEISLADSSGRRTEKLTIPFWIETKPFNWQDAVIYQVVTDRFLADDSPVDDSKGITARMGGTLAGVAYAIENGYFKRLGVNVIWISPANTNAIGWWPGFDDREYESYHGYWPIMPQEVEPRIGGAKDLELLVKTAHENGMRVILDVVTNHVHVDHPYFADHRKEWFNFPSGDCVCGRECSWGKDIEQCWFTDYLPDLDWKNKTVVEQISADTVWWLERFDLDGLRIDAVAMMPRLATRYIRYLANSRLSTLGAHVYLIGETFTGPGPNGRSEIRRSLGTYGLSAQFDFPLMWSIRSVLASGQGKMKDLLDEADASAEAWAGSGSVMGLILGNHDVPRFLSVASNDDVSDPQKPPAAPKIDEPYQRMALAFAFLYSLPGAPVVYYGDEYGMAGAGDPDNRRPMRFDNDRSDREKTLAASVALLGRLRRENRAMRYGKRQILLTKADQLAYLLSDGSELALVALNRAASAARLIVNLPDEVNASVAERLTDCMGGNWVKDGRSLTWVAPPFGLALLMNTEVCNAAN
jgi:glycosidase